MDCIKDNSSTEMPDGQTEQELQKICFLPVMKKPNNYPISWKGDAVASLLSGPELIKVSQDVTSVNAVYACGSQVAILDTQFLPYQSRNLSNKVLKLLGIKQEIEITWVVNHFKDLLQWFQNSDNLGKDLLSVTEKITNTVYQYLARKFSTNSDDEVLLNELLSLKDKCCIWKENRFLLPECVSFNWNADGPYLYRLPDALKKFRPLMEQLGIKDIFPTNVMLAALSDMKSDYGNSQLSFKCQAVVKQSLQYLGNCDLPSGTDIFLPDIKFVLRNVKELKYNDAPWCPVDEGYLYCSGCVERDTAIHLGVEPVRSILLDDLDITSDEIEEFGQVEELPRRLNELLRLYPRDVTFLKELIQNADDANATKLYFILDKREHSNLTVISEEWKALQGPALLFWNDSPFSDEDLVGIQKIGLGNKRDDPDKIGQYGIGFNVVYHFTDCPSFITNDQLCIMDPHYRYIARKRMKPGRMYKGLEKLWARFPDMKSSYLRNDLDEFPVEMRVGSLFRLPLRLTKKDAENSAIVANDGYYNLQVLEKDLENWVAQMKEALLFVHHVRDVRLYVIDEAKPVEVFTWEDPHSVSLCKHIESNKWSEKVIKQSGNAKLVFYNMKLSNKRTNEEEKWLIQLGEGNIDNSSFEWMIPESDIEIHPRHGIATRIDDKQFNGKSFCFLPLSGSTKLPVHIHGQFVLHSDRRTLWVSSSDDITDNDKKAAWNKHLLEAISVSYANFLIHIIAPDGRPCNKQKSLQFLKNYYKFFPSIVDSISEPWRSLASNVYKLLSKMNPPILATLVENNLLEHSHKDGEKLYTIKWNKLHLPQALNEGYFHSFDSYHSDICGALKAIGMNLLDTPSDICDQFQTAGIILPVVSEESVMNYYIRFQDEIFNHRKLPCHVSKSKFGKVECFLSLIEYISIHGTKSNASSANKSTLHVALSDIAILEKNVDDSPIFNAGFVMTADENIHALSDGKKIVNSANWKLFPKSSSSFLHQTLLKQYNNSPYIFQSSEVDKYYDFIHSIFAANLPPSLCGVSQIVLQDMNVSQVEKVLVCISEDAVFAPYRGKLLASFALIPASVNNTVILYSSKSEILPMKINTFPYKMSLTKLQDLLRKLNVHFVNSSVLGSVLTNTNITLPNIGNASDVLKCVYMANRDHYSSLKKLTNEELAILFDIFRLVTFSPFVNCQSVFHIKNLPIFTTINDELVQLSSFSPVWIWNRHVCRAGVEEWINHVPESVAFLDPDGPWKTVCNQAEELGIKEISLYDVYCKYIFCQFNTMKLAIRLEHIKFIAKNLYKSCRFESECGQSDNYWQAENFIYQFKSLQCLGEHSSNMHTIGFYYDHTQDIFKFFCKEDRFLPKELQNDDIQECLKFFGLRTVPTTAEFFSYCQHITTLNKVSDVLSSSEILLKCLFQEDSNGYEHILSDAFLWEVSNTPIGIVEVIPDLNAIKTQQLGDCDITDMQETVHLAKLAGSSPVEFKHSVWTCKPLVCLPVSRPYNKITVARMKALGISVMPSIPNVIQNLRNIANTTFADVSGFNKQTFSKSSYVLPEVIVEAVKCIADNLKVAQSYDDTCQWLKSQVENLNFLPVRLPEKGYVLVAPCQVLFTTPTQLTPYYPFLHPLIDQLQPHFLLLSRIGVKMSLDYSHMHLVFKLAKHLCEESRVDQDIKCAIVQATVDLTMLLRNTEDKQNLNLQPLYLLNDQDILTDCSSLVVRDVSGAPPVLPTGLAYLNPLPNLFVTKYWSPKELLRLLPPEVGLKSLRSILQHQMINATPVLTAYTCVTTIEQILRCNNFRVAIESYACFCKNTREPPQIVTKLLTNFQSNLEVQYLEEIQVNSFLSVNSQIFPLQDTVSQDFFLRHCESKYILSLKNSSNNYRSKVFSKLSRSLCSMLKLKSTKCFEVSDDDDDVPELTFFVCEIISCGSVFKVAEIIQNSLPGFESIEQDLENPDPVLGKVILDCWHHRLDQNIFNYYLPEEWVGYEIVSGSIVYAQVLHCFDYEAPYEKGSVGQSLLRKYLITVGSEPIEVSLLQLYKSVSDIKESVPQVSEAIELELHNSTSTRQVKQARQAGGRKTIRDAVKAAWSLPVEQKRKALKRLYLQYHPDKNLGNPNATAEFQYLLQEMERMEKGYPEDSLDAEHPFREPGSFNFGWNGWFNLWNQTASSHKKYKSKDRAKGASGGGTTIGWHTPKPQTNHEEAIRWIKQAEYDYTALKVLMASCQIDVGAATLASSQTDEKTCASTCFMCHEVAEKSLKAGMYAKCGIGESTLKNHNVVSPAHALIQMGCEIDVNDAIFLENFYYHPRFPSYHPPPTAPGEKYVINTATQAFDATTRIYEAMKKVVEDGDD